MTTLNFPSKRPIRKRALHFQKSNYSEAPWPYKEKERRERESSDNRRGKWRGGRVAHRRGQEGEYAK